MVRGGGMRDEAIGGAIGEAIIDADISEAGPRSGA